LGLSKKEYDRLFENFNTLKSIIESYKKETIENYYDPIFQFIDDILQTYSTISELREKKFLLKSYLNKMESSLTEDDKEYTDENDIKYGSLLQAYNFINEKINFNEEKLSGWENEKNNLLKFNLFKELTQSPIITKYKFYECEFNFENFKCRGNKEGSSRWRYKNLG